MILPDCSSPEPRSPCARQPPYAGEPGSRCSRAPRPATPPSRRGRPTARSAGRCRADMAQRGRVARRSKQSERILVTPSYAPSSGRSRPGTFPVRWRPRRGRAARRAPPSPAATPRLRGGAPNSSARSRSRVAANFPRRQWRRASAPQALANGAAPSGAMPPPGGAALVAQVNAW